MKNVTKLFGLIALALVMGFSFVNCGGGAGSGPGDGGDSTLSGNITITPNAGVTVGTELTANYSGSETVSYQWKKGTTNVGANSNKYTPDAVGEYTVTVSATGYISKTSGIVTVLEGSGTKVDPFKLTADKWADGIITSTTTEVWYSFDATSGTTYRVWWNEENSPGGSKTLDVKVSGYYSDDTSISSFTDVDTSWTTEKSFSASKTDTVLLKVLPYYSGYTGTFGIVYSTSTTRPPVPINPQSPVPLTANQWKDGEITASSNGEAWYSFTVVSGTTYRVWWNDNGITTTGNGAKSLDVRVSGYYSDGTGISGFSNVDTAWSSATYFTPGANRAGTVYLKVTPYSAGGTGTFAIVYSTTTTRPAAAFNPVPTPLTMSQWKDGEITDSSGGAAWYSFSVSNATSYNIWLNELSPNGNGIKTLNVEVMAYYSDGGAVNGFTTSSATAWATARSFTPTKGGTVYLKVTPTTSGQIGTFGIVYNTGQGTARPSLAFNPPSTALTADVWTDGEKISSDPPWYSLTVTSGTSYYVWWNESGNNGNGTKTLDITVTAYDGSDGSILADFTDVATAWATAKSFTPTTNSTIYLRVASGQPGTFGIVYSTTNSRPVAPFVPPNPIALTADIWKDGEITANPGSAWYSFEVTNGSTYNVWWNDFDSVYLNNGDGSKTMNIKVSGYNSDGTGISGFADVDAAWTTVKSFAATASGTVYLRVLANIEIPSFTSGVGTFGVVYSTTSTRPDIPLVFPPSNTTALTADQWKDGEITASSNGAEWYSFTVTSGTTYYVWWNESDTSAGDNTKSLDVKASGYYSDGTDISTFSDTDIAWAAAQSFTPTANGTVYIRVSPSYVFRTGTFGIVYNTTGTRPIPATFNPVSPAALTAGTWVDGEITTSTSPREVWYSIAVTSGTTYYLWFNESGDATHGNGLKTLDITVRLYYSDATYISSIFSAWNGTSITASSTGTVYAKVTPNLTNSTGTFGIVYNTTNSRPAVSFTPPNPTTLTAGTWGEGNITTAGGQEWFTFTAASSMDYIHFSTTGTLNDVYVRVYDSSINPVGDETNMWSNVRYISRSLTTGQTYYIRVRPFSSSGTGNYKITFNSSTTAPASP